jgi:hypothetical protein
MKKLKIDFEWLNHFDGPVKSKPMTEEDLFLIRVRIDAEKKKAAAAKKRNATRAANKIGG